MDIPEPLGKPVIMSMYKDANLLHNLMSSKAMSEILHFINQTPIDWFSKKQGTVEMATYSSEFVAAHIAIDQIIDLHLMLWYLGVPIKGNAYLFGNNQSIVMSVTIPHSVLKKWHLALCYHHVREAVSSDILKFVHISSVVNPADILSKHWGYQQIWPVLHPVLFWAWQKGGPTMSRRGVRKFHSPKTLPMMDRRSPATTRPSA